MIHYSSCNIILLLYGKKKGQKHPLLISIVLGSLASQQLRTCIFLNASCLQATRPAYLKLQNVQWDCFSLISVTCIQRREQQERFQLVDTWHVDLTRVLSMIPEKFSIARQDYLLVLKSFGYLHFLYN